MWDSATTAAALAMPIGELGDTRARGPEVMQLQQQQLCVQPHRGSALCHACLRARCQQHRAPSEAQDWLVSCTLPTCTVCLSARVKDPAPWDSPSARNNFWLGAILVGHQRLWLFLWQLCFSSSPYENQVFFQT